MGINLLFSIYARMRRRAIGNKSPDEIWDSSNLRTKTKKPASAKTKAGLEIRKLTRFSSIYIAPRKLKLQISALKSIRQETLKLNSAN